MHPLDFESAILTQTHIELMALARTKGVEYSGTEDKLANFKSLGRELGLDPKVVLWVYLQKHLNAVRSYATTNAVRSTEPIRGRIRDAQLYLALLEALIVEDSERPATVQEINEVVEDVITRQERQAHPK